MTEVALRAYLLGKLTESEAERIEARLIEDAGLFAEMETAEDDLFDAFARGSLDADERARFLERFGADHQRRRFAQALVRRTSSRRPAPLVPRRWIGLAAAATLVIVVGGVLMRQRSVEAPGTHPAAAPATVAPAAPIATRVSLAIGGSRSVGAATKVAVAPDATVVDFEIRLNPADKFPAYYTEIRSQANNIVWADAARTVTNGGDLIVHAVVPVDRLPAGTYEIAVRGGANAGALDDLGFATIEVSRSR